MNSNCVLNLRVYHHDYLVHYRHFIVNVDQMCLLLPDRTVPEDAHVHDVRPTHH